VLTTGLDVFDRFVAGHALRIYGGFRVDQSGIRRYFGLSEGGRRRFVDAFPMSATQTCPDSLLTCEPLAGGDFALAQLSDGRLIVGRAPFVRSASAAEDGVSFYRNDFSLSDPQPWRIPASWQVLDGVLPLAAAAGGVPLPEMDWQEPQLADFESVFERVRFALASGDLVKAVPAVAARAKVAGDVDLAAALIGAARDPGASSWLYAFSEDGCGFVGLTPERLFCMDADRLQTMALAGTAVSAEGDRFARDSKEQREHQLVVEALRRRIGGFGVVSEGDREIIDVGGMVHFLTRFEVQLDARPSIDEVIAALHPTPAVGVVPRNAESLQMLDALRRELDVPSAFGAPFGVKVGARFEAFVSIRGVFWEAGQVFLPAGCGVVEASQLRREWAELELKRRWVKSAFGIA